MNRKKTPTLGTGLLTGLFMSFALFSFPLYGEVEAQAVWIDVRSPAEYAEGHLEEAVNVPFDAIEKGVTGMKLSTDTPIYLYCARGGRAEMARQSLVAAGYSNVTNAGGLEEARELAQPADQAP